ncbi:MAG: aminopeptidase [Bacilli bacterium]
MERKNVWEKYDNHEAIHQFAEGYKDFISNGKTERLAAAIAVKQLEESGFKDLSTFSSLKAGDKVYTVNRKKNVLAFVIGTASLTDGLRILGAHIDSPRLDFKEKPFYESHGFAYGNTHYYGGIKKYQWVTIPLALHGVVCLKDGSIINVDIGEDENDPVLGISDLLIHLAADQLQKTLAKGIEGENLDVTLGSIPLKGEKKDAVKANVLKLLKDKYGIEEDDFISSEIEVVPAGKAKDYGLDRSMIAGYGHDDRCCAYTSLQAFKEVLNPVHTTCLALVDKEEIGSVGATGAQSLFFENTVAKIAKLSGLTDSFVTTRTILENSKMLSSDVTAAYDPLFAQVFDLTNVAFFGEGIVFNKYTGSRGKSGSNDANPEYYAWLRNAMDKEGVIWQSSELGKVDQGGGGTIAYILGNYNMDVIDAGIPVLNMHAPMEVISKADLYEAYVGYRTFLLA